MNKFKPDFEFGKTIYFVPKRINQNNNKQEENTQKDCNLKEVVYEINELVWFEFNDNNWLVAQIGKKNSKFTYYIKYKHMIKLSHVDNIRKRIKPKNYYIASDTHSSNENLKFYRSKILRYNSDEPPSLGYVQKKNKEYFHQENQIELEKNQIG